MIDPRAKYQDALTAFIQPGGRWAGKGALTYWGKAAGLSADEIIADARAAGVSDRDADIRRGWNDAKPKGEQQRFTGGGSVRRYVRAKPTAPPQPTDRVRNLIEAGRDIDTPEKLRELSPAEIYPGTDETARRIQSEAGLQLLFGMDEIVHIRADKADNRRAKPSENLRPMRDWLFDPRPYGEILRPNPFAGNQGLTGDGRQSFTCKDTIAAFRHAVFEFDDMPIVEQCRFWAGVIRRGALPLVSLTHSGGKSIHGVVRVDAPDAGAWSKYRAQIIERYAADPDPRYRLDVQALNPLVGCRLAGAVRRDTGKVQELLYDCGKWSWQW